MHTLVIPARTLEGYPEGQEKEVKVTIHHNGDFSGEVIIQIPTEVGQPETSHYSEDGVDYHIAELRVPYEAIEALVAERVRALMIEALEVMDGPDLLKILFLKV